MKNKNQAIDILCVGEVLIDFIGHQSGILMKNTEHFTRNLGGSPTNVAANLAQLGLSSALVASVGNDGFGDYILERLQATGVRTNSIQKMDHKSTSVIFITKSDDTPDFIPYRNADFQISEDQISSDLLKQTTVFHTTCFALSKNPAQTTILNKAKEAYRLGCQLSIDVNYSKKIWDNQEEAMAVIKAYCQFNPLVKVSEVDMLRLFGYSLKHQAIFDFFHLEGVETVCLTLGKQGVKLSQKGKEVIELPAVEVPFISDTTGAGDAFWSGFLYANIKEKTIEKCLEIALDLAALKLQNVGELPIDSNRTSLFL